MTFWSLEWPRYHLSSSHLKYSSGDLRHWNSKIILFWHTWRPGRTEIHWKPQSKEASHPKWRLDKEDRAGVFIASIWKKFSPHFWTLLTLTGFDRKQLYWCKTEATNSAWQNVAIVVQTAVSLKASYLINTGQICLNFLNNDSKNQWPSTLPGTFKDTGK